MITLFNIYASGAYLAILLYCFLLEYDGFRDYMEDIISVGIINNPDIPTTLKNQHPYSFMIDIAILFFILSWVGVILICALLSDYLNRK